MRIIKKSYQSMKDEALIISLSKGDQKAFNEIYERYAGPLMGFFMRKMWNDREKAEDFVHDFFAKIIRKPASFDPTRSFKTWAYSVANNMCKNEYKKQEVRKNTTSGLDRFYSLKDENSNVMNQVQDAQFKNRFDQELNALKEKHRDVFYLKNIKGLSIKEIAEIVETSEGTVKSRLFYATKYLSDKLKEFNPVLNQ